VSSAWWQADQGGAAGAAEHADSSRPPGSRTPRCPGRPSLTAGQGSATAACTRGDKLVTEASVTGRIGAAADGAPPALLLYGCRGHVISGTPRPYRLTRSAAWPDAAPEGTSTTRGVSRRKPRQPDAGRRQWMPTGAPMCTQRVEGWQGTGGGPLSDRQGAGAEPFGPTTEDRRPSVRASALGGGGHLRRASGLILPSQAPQALLHSLEVPHHAR
jgi:hypothetical protein